MKRKAIILTLISLILLCGCTGYREIERGYFVTAIGFTKQNGGFGIVLETLAPSDIEPSGEGNNLLSGSGKTLDAAYGKIKNSLTKSLYFEHCGVIVVSRDFTENEILEIFDFCTALNTLNIDVYVAQTDDVTALFETETTDESVGYSIIGLIKNAGNNGFSNQLYQIKRQGVKTVLPTVSVRNNTLVSE